MWLIKWRLMLTTLPYVAAAVLCRLTMERVFGFYGTVELGDVSVVMTGSVFLLGFMLTGTLADYKESEKLPAELASTLEAIEELLYLSSVSKPKLQERPLRSVLAGVADAILARLYRRKSSDELYSCLSSLNAVVRQMEEAGCSPLLSGRVLGELHNLRRMLTRIDVISRTSFLASGYALLETLVTVVIALLLAARYRSTFATYTMVTFACMMFVYVVRLIRDVDDPFEYSADGKAQGAAEVDLSPLTEYRKRLAQRPGGELPSEPAAAPPTQT
jgi:hypothetical protein